MKIKPAFIWMCIPGFIYVTYLIYNLLEDAYTKNGFHELDYGERKSLDTQILVVFFLLVLLWTRLYKRYRDK